MPEPTSNPEPSTEPAPGEKPGEKPGEGGGTDPKKTETPAPQAADVSKMSDEDFSKVFDDPRLWNHPRFKSLNEAAKKAKEFEEAEATRKQDDLKKKGEWEKVAEAAEEKAKTATENLQKSIVDNQIQAQAVKAGAIDLEVISKLIDRTIIKVGDDGTVTGVEEAVKVLLDSKPYLKGSESARTVGNATAPGAENQPGLKKFKLSQIQDTAFYKENEKDILASMKAGLVEDDMAA